MGCVGSRRAPDKKLVVATVNSREKFQLLEPLEDRTSVRLCALKTATSICRRGKCSDLRLEEAIAPAACVLGTANPPYTLVARGACAPDVLFCRCNISDQRHRACVSPSLENAASGRSGKASRGCSVRSASIEFPSCAKPRTFLLAISLSAGPIPQWPGRRSWRDP